MNARKENSLSLHKYSFTLSKLLLFPGQTKHPLLITYLGKWYIATYTDTQTRNLDSSSLRTVPTTHSVNQFLWFCYFFLCGMIISSKSYPCLFHIIACHNSCLDFNSYFTGQPVPLLWFLTKLPSNLLSKLSIAQIFEFTFI